MNTNPAVTANRILQEQIEIEELTVHLLSELAKRQCVRQRIVKLFQDLRERVVAHFCDEERGGFVEQQVRDNPELAAAFLAKRSSKVAPRSILALFRSGVNCASMSRALFMPAGSIRPVCE